MADPMDDVATPIGPFRRVPQMDEARAKHPFPIRSWPGRVPFPGSPCPITAKTKVWTREKVRMAHRLSHPIVRQEERRGVSSAHQDRGINEIHAGRFLWRTPGRHDSRSPDHIGIRQQDTARMGMLTDAIEEALTHG